VTVTIYFHEEVTLRGEIGLVSKGSLRKALERIREEPSCGKPLRGALTGCRSVRVDGVLNRLVYEVKTSPSVAPTVVVILAIERRRDSEAYDLAESRR
jgi:mRNA-degrading endonuclease RelE of RelBE toxin-antitoxin system